MLSIVILWLFETQLWTPIQKGKYVERLYLYRNPMYVQRLVLSLGNVALFRKEEFGMYIVMRICYTN